MCATCAVQMCYMRSALCMRCPSSGARALEMQLHLLLQILWRKKKERCQKAQQTVGTSDNGCLAAKLSDNGHI